MKTTICNRIYNRLYNYQTEWAVSFSYVKTEKGKGILDMLRNLYLMLYLCTQCMYMSICYIYTLIYIYISYIFLHIFIFYIHVHNMS